MSRAKPVGATTAPDPAPPSGAQPTAEGVAPDDASPPSVEGPGETAGAVDAALAASLDATLAQLAETERARDDALRLLEQSRADCVRRDKAIEQLERWLRESRSPRSERTRSEDGAAIALRRWRNPSTDHVRLTLHDAEGVAREVAVEPRGAIELPALFADAVRMLAPQLVLDE